MIDNEETGTYLSKTPSETPSVSPSRQSSRRMKTSKSSVSMMRSSTQSPQREVSQFSHKSRISQQTNRTEIVKAEKPEIPKSCECGPDLYSKVLGPTADETILTGLQTVIDLCNKLRDCGTRDDSGEEEPEREQDFPERDVPVVRTSKSQTDRSMVSAGFQVNPSTKIAATQTEPFPKLVSAMLQTVGLSPELISKVIQTSFPDTSLTSIYMQTSSADLASAAMQTTYPDMISGIVQTSSGLLPRIKTPPTENVKTQSDLVEPYSQEEKTYTYTGGDEHKAISPPEPPEQPKVCKCCQCSSGSFRKDSKEMKTSDERPCICGSRQLSKCTCEAPKDSATSMSEEHQLPTEVKYAVTKISKFNDFTTFEIMKSTKNKPKHIPRGIEGVFVLKKKNGGPNGEFKRIYGGSKSDTDGLKNKRSKNGSGMNGSKNTTYLNGSKNTTHINGSKNTSHINGSKNTTHTNGSRNVHSNVSRNGVLKNSNGEMNGYRKFSEVT